MLNFSNCFVYNRIHFSPSFTIRSSIASYILYLLLRCLYLEVILFCSEVCKNKLNVMYDCFYEAKRNFYFKTFLERWAHSQI